MDILARFLHLQIEEKKLGGKTVKRETMIFPRYHQLDCVRKLRGRRARGRRRPQLPDPALGRQRQEQLHRLARPPPREPALERRREGLRLGRRGHRPPRARQAAAGHDLPVRAQAGRGASASTRTRTQLAEALEAGDADRHHDAAEVPLRHREDRRAARSAATPSSSTRRTARRAARARKKMKDVLAGAHVAEQAAE